MQGLQVDVWKNKHLYRGDDLNLRVGILRV